VNIHPIRSDADHHEALGRIEALWGAKAGTPEGDELEVLVTLVEAYEESRFQFPPADSVDVLRAVMEERGLGQSDFAKLIGSRSRASEILNRKRALSLDQIRAIRTAWRIPADALID
jgi:HTH-type transcriptional regulator/antitoxin HigA